MYDVSIIFPAYNEEAAIVSEVTRAREVMDRTGYKYELIVVDDGSKDRTAELAEQHGATVFRHERNAGVGAARKTGIRRARGEIVVMSDADGTYPLDQIPQLLAEMDRHDMVIGARKAEAGTMKILRRPAKWLILKLACFVTNRKIPDLNSGLRAFRRKTALKFVNILPNTHSWVSTITIAFLANDYSVSWIPIDYFPRKGHSTFHPIRDSYTYITLVIRTVVYFNPLRFFVPLSLVILAGGTARFLYHAFFSPFPVPGSDIMLIMTGVLVGVMGVLADLVIKTHRSQYLETSDD